MPYLIDGHNLIPKIKGLSLSDIDDEMQLVELLQEYCRIRHKQVEAFFDNSPSGQPRIQHFGLVTARFVRQGKTADDAIHQRLTRLGREARNWTVVSSDLEVQASARAARAQYMKSEDFARELEITLQQNAANDHKQDQGPLSEDEIENWLDLFRNDRPTSHEE